MGYDHEHSPYSTPPPLHPSTPQWLPGAVEARNKLLSVMTPSFRRTPKIAFAVGLALVSQSAFAQTVVERDFGGIANEYASAPPVPAETGFKMSVVPAGSTELLFYRKLLDSADETYSRWTNLELVSEIGRVDTTFALVPLEFDPNNSDPRLNLSTLTLRDMNLNSGLVQFGFRQGNTALVLDNASLDLGVLPVFRSDSNLSLRTEGTAGINTISKLTGNVNSPTTINVASGTTLQFFGSGRLDDGLANSARSNFTQSNSAVINGTLDIDQSYVIFNTGSGQEMLVNSGGRLTLTGAQTVLETGDLRVNGGTVELGIGGARLGTNDFTLNGATVNVGASSTLESSGGTVATGTNTIDLGNGAKYTTGLLATGGGSVTFSGSGTVSTQQVGFAVSGDKISLTESTTLEVTSGAGDQSLERGSLDIGVNAVVDIQAGAAVVARSGTIHNDGALLVSGRLEPGGTMTGDGFIRVETFGQLGGFGQFPTDTFTTSTDIFMDGFSTFEVLVTPDLVVAQQLIANGDFALSPLGVYLNPLVISATDVALAPGTKFAIVDYQDGNDLEGNFMRSDNSLILEGGTITAGLNTYSLSYSDGDYSPGSSSYITLTAVPEPSSFALILLAGTLGLTMVRRWIGNRFSRFEGERRFRG